MSQCIPTVRYAQVDTEKKPFLAWMWQTICCQFPYRGLDDDDVFRWMWKTRIAHRYKFKLGPALRMGDAGYDEAEYEMFYLTAKSGFERQVHAPW